MSDDKLDIDDDLDIEMPSDEGCFVLLSIFAFFGAIALLVSLGLLTMRYFGPIN